MARLKQPRESGTALAALSLIAPVVAATAVGFAIHLNRGEYSPGAISLITVALIATIVGFAMRRVQMDVPREAESGWLEYALGSALILQLVALFILWPVGEDHRSPWLAPANRLAYLYLLGSSAFITLLGFVDLPSMRRWWFPAALVVQAMLGIWTVRSSPTPHIDVWYFQQGAAQALIDGRNPYDCRQVNYPDIYDSTLPGHQRVYGEGMVEDGRLLFGFPYPPLSLYCSTLGYALGQDTRYAQAIALTLAGLFMGYARPGRIPKLAAMLLLYTPTAWYVLGRAWTEPFVVMFLAATVFCASRNLRWLLPVALGLLLASKQYLVFTLPLSFLLLTGRDGNEKPRLQDWIILLAGAGIVVAAVTLPLALRDFPAFWFSVVTVQAQAPFRWDALSYVVAAGLIHSRATKLGEWPALVAASAALVWTVRKTRPSAGGFAGAMAIVYLAFIAFNKQAFCNYYFFAIGCLCCAIAASQSTEQTSDPSSP